MSANVANTDSRAQLPIRSRTELDAASRAPYTSSSQLRTAGARPLGLGAQYAARRFLPDLPMPVHSSIPGPEFTDASTAIHTTSLIAAGALAWHESVAPVTNRILGFGAEGWLAWAFLDGSPLPLWLVPGMPPEEIHRCVSRLLHSLSWIAQDRPLRGLAVWPLLAVEPGNP